MILRSAAVLLLALVLQACAARRVVVPDHPFRRAAAGELADVTLALRSFRVDGTTAQDHATVPMLQQAFAGYVSSQTRFKDVIWGEAPTGAHVIADVGIKVDHSAWRTLVLDVLFFWPFTGYWPLTPMWGAAEVAVTLTVESPDGGVAWKTTKTASDPYSMFTYSYYRTAPIENAYKVAYAKAFDLASAELAKNRHLVVAAVRPARGPAAIAGAEPRAAQAQTPIIDERPAVAHPAVATAAPAPVREASAQVEGGKLAMLDLRTFAADISKQDAQYFTDVVRGQMLKRLPRFHMITRENLLVLLQAQGRDLASCEGECEVETGRNIGADVIVSGEVHKLGSRYKVSLRLHDTRAGRLLATAIASGASIDQLDDSLAKAAEELAAPIR